MPSEADRLLAAGFTLPVVGGEEVLRFSLSALKRCEDQYGHLDGVVDEIRWLIDQRSSGFLVPVVDRLMVLLSTVTGSPSVDATVSPAQCIDALLDAWLEAFPAVEGKAEGEATAPPFRGGTGGGSPSSTPT